jgi:hypothetical protein
LIPTPAADALAKLPTVNLQQWRGVRDAELAMAGDLDAAIRWLRKHGGPPWQPRSQDKRHG